MAISDHLRGDTSTPIAPSVDKAWSVANAGPFIGIVKGNKDPTFMGRLKVLIPSLAGTFSPSEDQLITCEYLSPFYGAKSSAHSTKNKSEYNGSQHSYGFWAVPPDLDTSVLVIFAEGKINKGFWIGCIQEPYTNHMVPGIASAENTIGDSPPQLAPTPKKVLYGTDNVPSGELNREAPGALSSSYDSIPRPIHPFANTLRKQGLIQDDVRGNTSSSARRESPSQVFGISTPGRLDPTSPKKNVGTKDAGASAVVDRLTGHTFTMDDGDARGNNQLIRLRSASGHQILMHDNIKGDPSQGVIYIATGSGNSWIEFANNGCVDIYSQGINLRSAGDINFHSDSDINMFARNEVKIKSLNKMVLDSGTIQQLADYDIMSHSLNGAITQKAPGSMILTYSGSGTQHHSGGDVHLAGSGVHFNSIGASSGVIPNIERSGVVSRRSTGTGTQVENIPDVNPAKKHLMKPLEIDMDGNVGMAGMRVPTHEPWPFHFDQVKTYHGESSTEAKGTDAEILTSGWLAYKNRTDSNSSIRQGQFQADLAAELQKATADGAKGIALDRIAETFTKNYAKNYKLPDIGPFKLPDISQIKGINETIDQTIKQAISGTISNLTDFVSVGTTGNLSTTLASSLSKNLLQTTSYKSIMAGKVTAMTAITNKVSAIGSSIVSSSIGQAVSSAVGNIFKFFSDVRLKEDIQLIGKSPKGVNIYRFKYKYVDGIYQGVIAQEVPWANEMTNTGFYAVDYNKLDVEFRRLH